MCVNVFHARCWKLVKFFFFLLLYGFQVTFSTNIRRTLTITFSIRYIYAIFRGHYLSSVFGPDVSKYCSELHYCNAPGERTSVTANRAKRAHHNAAVPTRHRWHDNIYYVYGIMYVRRTALQYYILRIIRVSHPALEIRARSFFFEVVAPRIRVWRPRETADNNE